MNEYSSHLPQWLILRYPWERQLFYCLTVEICGCTIAWSSGDFPRMNTGYNINTEVNRANNTTWRPGWRSVVVCHQSCEMWNCSAAVLRIREPVIVRLLSPVMVEIIPQSLHERILVVSIQTTVIQHCKMVRLTKTPSWSHRQRWVSVSLAAPLLKSRSGNSCKTSFFLLFEKGTSVCYNKLFKKWLIPYSVRLQLYCISSEFPLFVLLQLSCERSKLQTFQNHSSVLTMLSISYSKHRYPKACSFNSTVFKLLNLPKEIFAKVQD